MFEGFSAPIEPDSASVVVTLPLLTLDRAFSSKSFPEKYPARHLAVPLTAAALTFDFPEKFLVTVLEAVLVWNRQDMHTVLRPLDLRALAGEYLIIIACVSNLVEALNDIGIEVHGMAVSHDLDGSSRFIRDE